MQKREVTMNYLFIMWVAQPKMPAIWPFVKIKGQKAAHIDTHFSLFVRLGMHISSFWGLKDNQVLFLFFENTSRLFVESHEAFKREAYDVVRGGCNWFNRLDLFSSDSKRSSETPQNHASMTECCVRGKEQFQMKQGFVRWCKCTVASQTLYYTLYLINM